MDKEAVVHIYSGILLSHKKEHMDSVLRQINLEPIIQSEASQKEKYISIFLYILFYMYLLYIIIIFIILYNYIIIYYIIYLLYNYNIIMCYLYIYFCSI